MITSPKYTRAAYISSAAVFAFSLFFMMPLDVYFNNQIDYNIGARYVVLPLLLCSLLVFSAVFLLPPLFIKRNGIDVLILILAGISLACYAQTLFFNGRMRELTGDGVYYAGDMSVQNLLNFFVWLFIAFLPLCIWKALTDSKKHNKVNWKTGVAAVCVIMLTMQASGLIAAVLTNPSVSFKYQHYLSYDRAFELSSNENICVFIMDRLDVKFMDEALEVEPEIALWLDGFTYYRNNISEYTHTFPSVTTMLTNVYYEPQDTWSQYWDKAWGGYTPVDELLDNGYTASLLIGGLTTYGESGHISERVNNLEISDISHMRVNYYEILKSSLKFSLGRTTPYIVKDFFIANVQPNFSNAFTELAADDSMPAAVGIESDIMYFNRLKQVRLRAPYNEKVFSLAHFNCAHLGQYPNGYHFNKQTGNLETGGTLIDTVHGSFAILDEYFEQMKTQGIYDKSTIIILADHGKLPFGFQALANEQLDAPFTSALFIKPKNTHGSLIINSKSELSHKNFVAGIVEIAGLPHDKYGISYFDIIRGDLPQKRVLYLTMPLENKTALMGKYEITGDANNFENWTYIVPNN